MFLLKIRTQGHRFPLPVSDRNTSDGMDAAACFLLLGSKKQAAVSFLLLLIIT
jgi:hypothetical protein